MSCDDPEEACGPLINKQIQRSGVTWGSTSYDWHLKLGAPYGTHSLICGVHSNFGCVNIELNSTIQLTGIHRELKCYRWKEVHTFIVRVSSVEKQFSLNGERRVISNGRPMWKHLTWRFRAMGVLKLCRGWMPVFTCYFLTPSPLSKALPINSGSLDSFLLRDTSFSFSILNSLTHINSKFFPKLISVNGSESSRLY